MMRAGSKILQAEPGRWKASSLSWIQAESSWAELECITSFFPNSEITYSSILSNLCFSTPQSMFFTTFGVPYWRNRLQFLDYVDAAQNWLFLGDNLRGLHTNTAVALAECDRGKNLILLLLFLLASYNYSLKLVIKTKIRNLNDLIQNSDISYIFFQMKLEKRLFIVI